MKRQNGLIIGASGQEKITNIVIKDEYNPSQRQNNTPVVYLASATLSGRNLVSLLVVWKCREKHRAPLSSPRFPAIVGRE